MVLQPTHLKKGIIFLFKGEVYESLDYEQKAFGRQQANVIVKARHLRTGKVQANTFKGDEKLQPVEIIKQSVQFLYRDSSFFYFMNQTSFEEHKLAIDIVAQQSQFLKEGQFVILILQDNKPLRLELPKNVALKVIQADTVVKGNTANNVSKEVCLETGLRVKVPNFIECEDIISIDTLTGAYRERQKDCLQEDAPR